MNTAAFASAPRSSLMPGVRHTATPVTTPIVFVVDDDISVRESLESLIADAGWRPEVFVSAEAFLACPRQHLPGCLVLDVSLPDLNGLELQERLADQTDLPIIFITGHGDIPMTVQAMKAGAIEFLTKPYGPEVLLSAIEGAIERSRASLEEEADLQVLRDRYESLTASRAAGHGAGRSRSAEQASRRRTRHQRDHGQGAQRTSDAKDGGEVAGGTREHGGAPWACHCGQELSISPRCNLRLLPAVAAMGCAASSLNPVHAQTAGSKDGRVKRAGLHLTMAGGHQVALGRMGARQRQFQVALRSVH